MVCRLLLKIYFSMEKMSKFLPPEPTLSHGNSYIFYEVANSYDLAQSYDLVRFV